MISSNRFIAKQSDKEAWLAARREGVTATEVAKASTQKGFTEALADRKNPVAVHQNRFMAWGVEQEPVIAKWVKESTGVMPNDWLISCESNKHFLATPDGLSLDHSEISEIKTTGKDYGKPPLAHMRQMQWQLLVTGAEKCFYSWMLRRELEGEFVWGWFEPRCVVVERDEAMIADLIKTADLLLIDFEGWEQAHGSF